MLFFRLLFSLVIVSGCAQLLRAGELTYRDLASPEMAVLVEVDRPLQVIDNPLGRDVWELLRQTTGVQKALNSPEVERFRQVGRFIEKSLGVNWQTGISRLTAGGIFVVIQPAKTSGKPSEPSVTVVVTAADEQTLRQFLEAVQAEIRRSAGAAATAKVSGAAAAKSAAAGAPDAEITSYRTFAIHRVGNGYFSQVGRQLVASNARRQLESALDHLADPTAIAAFNLPESLHLVDANGSAPAIRVTANLSLVRQDPKTQSGLQLPAHEPLPPFLLGGYLDLLRRADFVTAGLFVNGPGLELKVRFPVGADGAYAGLSGFFAAESSDAAPPLLRPTGTIFSAGWYRDYQKLWESRRVLLTPDRVKELDAANERELSRNDGLRVGISDLVKWIGPHFRVVAARPHDGGELPAGAVVVSLRDEPAVRGRILLPVGGLLLTAKRNNVMDYETSDYRGALLTQIRFAGNAGNNFLEKSILAQLHPAYATARGQLILGSTAEIVRDLIDELDRQPQAGSGPDSSGERVTDRQELSLAELSEFLAAHVDRMERDTAQKQGLSPAAAAKEVDIFRQLLKRLGQLTTNSVVGPEHFEVRVRLGGEGIEDRR